jgi:DNA-binding NarL/FixJ family response regulator
MEEQRRLTVLVVDQHEEVCHLLGRALEALPEVEVLAHTTNLMLAAELAQQFSPDAIVVDLHWGQVARPEILRWLSRASPESALIVYSSYYLNGEREEFAKAGARCCLLKGMSARDLYGELSKVAGPNKVVAGSGARSR